jgi:hypothetical protein
MILVGLNFATVNWYMILYILASIAFLIYGTTRVYATGQTRGVLFAIGALIVLVYFGLRWFGNRIKKPATWPPIINMCPDYLTYVKELPGCIDMLGVSRSASGLNKTLPSALSELRVSDTRKVFEYTSEHVRAAKTEQDIKAICDRCQNAGITWEGVYDGDTCVGISKQKGENEDKERCLISV